MCRVSISGLRFEKLSGSLLRPLAGAVLMALSGVSTLQAEELQYVGDVSANDGAGLQGASSLTVSPDNKYIYVAAATDFGLGFFERANNGQPSYLDFYPAMSDLGSNELPLKVLLSPDGLSLYTIHKSFDKSSVVFYGRDIDNGGLHFNSRYEGLDDIANLAMSNDGRSLYVSGSNALVVFQRDTSTGALSKKVAETQYDGANGVDGLAGSNGLALTPDGNYLFVAGTEDDAVAVFSRNTSTGALSFVEVLRNDPNKRITGLAGAISLALSPDGVNLYVVGAEDNALAIFKRNIISGSVSYLETWTQNGINGDRKVPELNGISSVVVSPNGSRVYTSSTKNDAIAVFKTLSQSRKLDFMEVQAGVSGVVSLTTNPNGLFLYAVSPVDKTGSITVFRTANTAPVTSNDELTVAAGGALSVSVLANDSDPDNDALHLLGADNHSVQGGIVGVNSDGTLTYTAPANFSGSDSFSYFVSDARDAEEVVGQVNVTVTPVVADSIPSDSRSLAGNGGSSGGGSLNGWMAMLLLIAGALRRRCKLNA
jgi:6-phosphogluconolactonase (cycloisomerase 2 family)